MDIIIRHGSAGGDLVAVSGSPVDATDAGDRLHCVDWPPGLVQVPHLARGSYSSVFILRAGRIGRDLNQAITAARSDEGAVFRMPIDGIHEALVCHDVPLACVRLPHVPHL